MNRKKEIYIDIIKTLYFIIPDARTIQLCEVFGPIYLTSIFNTSPALTVNSLDFMVEPP